MADYSPFPAVFPLSGRFSTFAPPSTLSAPLLRLAPSSIPPYSHPMPSRQNSCHQSRHRSSSPAARLRGVEALPSGTCAASRKTRFDCAFSENSTAISLVFYITCHQQSQKWRYSQRQHNILCFILDTPYRARYFHHCVTQTSSAQVPSNSGSLSPQMLLRPGRWAPRSNRG
jgi:hypothetical protein